MKKRLTVEALFTRLSTFTLHTPAQSLPFSLSDYPIVELLVAFRLKRELVHQLHLVDRRSKSRDGEGKHWEWKSKSDKAKASDRRHDSVARSACVLSASSSDVMHATKVMERGLIRDEMLRPKKALEDVAIDVLLMEIRCGERISNIRGAIQRHCRNSSRQWLASFCELGDRIGRWKAPSANSIQVEFSFLEHSSNNLLFASEFYRIPSLSNYSPKKAVQLLTKYPSASSNPIVLRDLAYILLFRNPFATKESVNTGLRTLFVISRNGDGFSSFLAGKYYRMKKDYRMARSFFEKGVSNGEERCLLEIGNRIWNGTYPQGSRFAAIRYFERCPRFSESQDRLAEICDSLGQNEEKEKHLKKAARLGSFYSREYYVQRIIRRLKKNFMIRRFIYANQQKKDIHGFFALVNFRILTITGCDGSPTFYLNSALGKGNGLAKLYEELYFSHCLPLVKM